MSAIKLAEAKEIVRDPALQGPAILAFGPAIWRWLSAISNVDFLLSINEEKFAVVFQFMQNTGWWVLSLVGFFWLWMEWSKRRDIHSEGNRIGWPQMVLASSVVAFMFGVLVTVRATGSVPNIVVGWGGAAGTCSAQFDTRRLQSFKSDYKIALACGIQDATTDKLEDSNITFSKPFTIIDGGLPITTAFRPQMTAHLNVMIEAARSSITGSVPIQPGQQVAVPVSFQIWHDPVLVPNGVDLEKVTTLAELMRLGGKILRPEYFR